jgi:uncharacterized protein (DUF305 family)
VISLHQEIEISLLVQSRSDDIYMKRFARKVVRKNRSDIKLLTSWREAYFSSEKISLEGHQINLGNLLDLKNHQFNKLYIDLMIKELDGILLLMKRKQTHKRYDFFEAYLQRNEKMVKERKRELLKMNDHGLN